MRRVAGRLTRRSGLAAVFPAKYRRLVELIPRGALAIDAGANVGNVTGALARRKLDVIAFEPHPSAFAVLAERFADTPNVKCIRKAVAATDGPARLHLHPRSDRDALAISAASSLFAGKRNVDRDDWILVEAVDLDSFIAGLDRPVALLKLDVEGAEVDILDRLVSSGRIEEIGLVLVEMHDGVIPELAAGGAALCERLGSEAYRHVHLDWL